MKKIIFIAALAIATLASCTKEEKISSASDSPISFNTAVGKAQTKALIDQSNYPTNIPFGTFAYYLGKDETWDANKTDAQEYISNNQVSNESKSTTGTAWTTGTAYYWPKTGSLSFFSYSPYSISDKVSCLPETGIKISSYDVDADQGTDVMVADQEKDLQGNGSNGGYTGVPTIFRHVLSQIVAFNFTNEYYNNGNEDGDKRFTITNISINNIAYTGSYQEITANSVNAGWTATSGTKSYTLYNNETGTQVGGSTVNITPTDNGYLLVLPQTLGGNAEIEITYFIETYCNNNWVKENPYTAPSSLSGTWDENKKITYNISFDLTSNQIYWAPSVEPWETNNSGNINL
jgi:hypothetical protein